MYRTFQLRLKPTAKQRDLLGAILATSCDLFNASLQERRDAYKHGVRVGYGEQQVQLTELNRDGGLDGIAIDIAREPLRRVDRAFKGFFRRVKAKQKAGYPRFRSKDRYDSFLFNLPKFVGGNTLRIPNLGCVKFKHSRWIDGDARTATVKRVGKKWTAQIVMDIGPAPEKKAVSNAIGIDLGLTDFVTLSNGSAVPNPKWLKKEAVRIARAGQALARTKRGSNNRAKAREFLRRAYRRTADQRRNFCHHVSKAIIGKYDLIAYEDLKIANMAKGHFAKSIMDAAWGQLLFQLNYKAESAGKYAVAVNPKGTSQRCSSCSTVVKKTLSERVHSCPNCGLSLGRDHNAALNVLALGISAVDANQQNIYGKSCI